VSTLRAGEPRNSLSIQIGARDFIPFRSVQHSSGFYQTSNPTYTECKDFASCFMEML